jgi:PAS domain-containing protein
MELDTQGAAAFGGRPIDGCTRTADTGERMAAILAAVAVPLYVTDATGRLIFYNEQAAEMWGRRPALHTTRFCGASKLCAPAPGTAGHGCAVELVIAGGVAVSRRALAIKRPDGSTRHVAVEPKPIYDEQGALAGVVNVMTEP